MMASREDASKVKSEDKFDERVDNLTRTSSAGEKSRSDRGGGDRDKDKKTSSSRLRSSSTRRGSGREKDVSPMKSMRKAGSTRHFPSASASASHGPLSKSASTRVQKVSEGTKSLDAAKVSEGTKSLSDAAPPAQAADAQTKSRRSTRVSSTKSLDGGSSNHSRSRSKMRSGRKEEKSSTEAGSALNASAGSFNLSKSLSGGMDDPDGKVSKSLSDDKDDKDDPDGKKKMTKLEKIEQLQAKNALYKEEFKRVQKDRKLLKKEIETKKGEIEAMTVLLGEHVASIANLNSQLSQALASGDGKGGKDGGGNLDHYQNEIQRLEKENKKLQDELDALTSKVQSHNQELEGLNSIIRERDTEIGQLQEETTLLRKEIRETAIENKRLISASAESAELVQQMSALEYDRDRLEAELKDTVERATTLVKEREDAIADLLKENEDIKNEICRRDNEKELLLHNARGEDDSDKRDEEDEHVIQLRTELASVSTQLEELQDRNLILEEDVEGWAVRGSQMEKEVARLQDELYQAQQTLEASKAELKQADERAERAMEAAADADDALEEAEEEFRLIMLETTAKHKAALIEAKTRYLEQAAARADAPPSDVDQQADLLKQAMSKNTRVGRNKSWFGLIETTAAAAAGGTEGQQTGGNDEVKAENTKLAKRLDELEALVEEQEEEIKALKSELVQVRTTFNDTLYKNKKQMERLEHENQTYAQRVAELERQLQSGIPKTTAMDHDDDNSSLSSHS